VNDASACSEDLVVRMAVIRDAALIAFCTFKGIHQTLDRGVLRRQVGRKISRTGAQPPNT
jgi:hypothetical protein